MRANSVSESGLSILRISSAVVLCATATTLGALGLRAAPKAPSTNSNGNWSVVNSPNINAGTSASDLADITCLSSSNCWAVGTSYNPQTSFNRTLIEHWDGASWTVLPPAAAASDWEHQLSGVSCLTANNCWAVGTSRKGSGADMLIEHWNGSSWSVVAAPNSVNSRDYLNNVTCTSASNCWAVGIRFEPSSPSETLIIRWDGTSWTVFNSPNAESSADSTLKGITCAGVDDCWAIGNYWDENFDILPLTEHWDGVSWSVIASPNTGPPGNLLNDVACVSSSSCWLVGNGSLIEHWDGTAWTIVSSGTGGNLSSVSCSSTSDCWATGNYGTTTMIKRWNGASWNIVPSPNAGSDPNTLAGLDCRSSSQCWTVGYYGASASHKPLAEQWNGSSWSVVEPAPDNQEPRDNVLQDAVCVSASDCWAVGYYALTPKTTWPPSRRSLIQRWNGSAWTNDTSSVLAGSVLEAVTCLSTSDCWAVGWSGEVAATPVLEHWNGSSWTNFSPSSGSGIHAELRDVTCTSTSDCWAVGFPTLTQSNIHPPFIMHWNGTAWSVVPFSTDANYYNFDGVTCTAVSDCWAVGNSTPSDFSRSFTLVFRWNGSSWALVPSPNFEAAVNSFSDVTCTSAFDCFAVGQSGNSKTLIEHWNGSSWSIVPSPNSATSYASLLENVTCRSATDCWAVGRSKANANDFTLAEQWDGNSWSIVTSPSPLAYNHLQGVTCSPSACWAVGDLSVSTSDVQRTLITTLSPTIPPVGLIASRKIHGDAGIFDLDLPPTGNPRIECRGGGIDSAYTIAFRFINSLTSVGGASVTNGVAVTSANHIDDADPREYIVDLTGASSGQTVTITLTNVNDSAGNHGDAISQSIKILVGDTNGDGQVNSADIGQTKAQSGSGLTSANVRQDVNADGLINSGDVGLVKSKSGTALP